MRAKLLRRVAAAERDTNYQGIPVVIEWPRGSVREGTNNEGEKWSRTMAASYGFVPNTTAKGDEENLDVYIGPGTDAPTAYVIEQLKDDGSFDEPKVMLGFDSEEAAKETYLKHYPDGWESHIGDIYPITVKRLQEMVDAVQTANEQRTMEAADRAEQGKKVAQAKQASVQGRKIARLFNLEELRAAGRRMLTGPKFRKYIDMFVPNAHWDDLDDRMQRRVLIAEQNERLGIYDDPWMLIPETA